MKCNVGRTERIIRILVGLAILGLGQLYGTHWGWLGVIPIMTAITGWCPISALLNLSTCSDPNSTLPDTSTENPDMPLRIRSFHRSEGHIK